MEEMGAPLVDPHHDIALLCQVVATATAERITRDLARHGFDVRASHGYIIQGLLAGDVTSTQLAQRLGVSVQAVSKTVSELEDAGYLQRTRDASDGRARSIELTRRGHTMVRRSREARAAVRDQIADRLGSRNAGRLASLLREVAEIYDGLDAIDDRRVRPAAGLD